jgi:hypothetical protein
VRTQSIPVRKQTAPVSVVRALARTVSFPVRALCDLVRALSATVSAPVRSLGVYLVRNCECTVGELLVPM